MALEGRKMSLIKIDPDKRLSLLADKVRAQRNNLSSYCHRTQVLDAPVDQAAWAQYRQALRDIPQQDGFPENVIWPTKPE